MKPKLLRDCLGFFIIFYISVKSPASWIAEVRSATQSVISQWGLLTLASSNKENYRKRG